MIKYLKTWLKQWNRVRQRMLRPNIIKYFQVNPFKYLLKVKSNIYMTLNSKLMILTNLIFWMYRNQNFTMNWVICQQMWQWLGWYCLSINNLGCQRLLMRRFKMKIVIICCTKGILLIIQSKSKISNII